MQKRMNSLSSIITIVFILILGLNDTEAQSPNIDSDDMMHFYGDVMVNAQKSEHRLFAAEKFKSAFLTLLSEENSFEETLDSVIWVTQLYPPDSSFRLISWQVMHHADLFQYEAVIQKANGELIEFTDSRPMVNGAERSKFTHKRWYGALYYGLFPFKHKGEELYVLLGYDGFNHQLNRKVADIMRFTDDGVELGAPLFVKKTDQGEDIQQRILIEYSDAAAGRIQFNRDEKMIVYDHMVTVFTEGPSAGGVPMPDGSYEAYELKNGKWNYIEKVFSYISEEAPRERPVLEGRKGRDLFGRKKN